MGNLTNIQNALDDKAKAILSEYHIPNIAAVIVRDNGKTVVHTVQGVKNSNNSITAPNNQANKSHYFNVGSISKPITGFLIACLIKKGLLNWNTKIADVFTEFKSKAFRDRCGMNETFLETKVYELMAHNSGMNGYYYNDEDDNKTGHGDTDPFRFIQDQGIANGGNSRDKEWKNFEVLVYLRYLYVILCLKKEKYKLGSTQNLGYRNKAKAGYGSTCTIVTAMVERLMNKPFELIMTELLFHPLQMQIMFGIMPDGMQMHAYKAAQEKYIPVAGYNNEFAPYSSKFVTGGIHCTVSGMAQFIRYNLRALEYAAVFDITEYQAPVAGVAKGGLFLGGQKGYEPLNHAGATGGSRALVHIYQHSGHGFSVMVNCGGGPEKEGPDQADQALNEMFKKLEKIHNDWDTI